MKSLSVYPFQHCVYSRDVPRGSHSRSSETHCIMSHSFFSSVFIVSLEGFVHFWLISILSMLALHIVLNLPCSITCFYFINFSYIVINSLFSMTRTLEPRPLLSSHYSCCGLTVVLVYLFHRLDIQKIEVIREWGTWEELGEKNVGWKWCKYSNHAWNFSKMIVKQMYIIYDLSTNTFSSGISLPSNL